ncbi:MAG: RNA pseudouridine synthase, partial [Proteobacteria bacterium]
RQIYPVHRLDFEVSGLVLFAKNAKSHSAANGWFENRQVSKTYLAITELQNYAHIPPNIPNPRIPVATVPGNDHEWKSLLLRGKRRAYEHASGKPSQTIARVLASTKKHVLWQLHPKTGRPHQLRYELGRHGFPICGDALYGSNVVFSPGGIALRSSAIDFSATPGAASFGLPERVEVASEYFFKHDAEFSKSQFI